ncbi:MAG: hypothetical protein V1934_00710 [Methanobacteriota archaeon]
MKEAAVCVMCVMLTATTALPVRASAGSNATQGTMNVVLDTQNNLLTITIVSETPWDSAMNFAIVPKKVLIAPVDERGGYQGMTAVKIDEKIHREVYKVIPKGNANGNGVVVRFNCNHTGLAATFLDERTVRLGPFHVSIDGLVTGGAIPLTMEPNQIEPN